MISLRCCRFLNEVPVQVLRFLQRLSSLSCLARMNYSQSVWQYFFKSFSSNFLQGSISIDFFLSRALPLTRELEGRESEFEVMMDLSVEVYFFWRSFCSSLVLRVLWSWMFLRQKSLKISVVFFLSMRETFGSMKLITLTLQASLYSFREDDAPFGASRDISRDCDVEIKFDLRYCQ